jgi:hypothetical protein
MKNMGAFFAILILLLLAVGLATGDSFMSTQSSQPSGSSAPTQQQPSGASTGTHQSDGSITGSQITNDPSTWPGSDNTWNVCTAVALAEGFNLGNGTAPYDLNNPGDLSPGDENGEATAGPAQQHGGSAIIYFSVCEGGFRALYAKFNRIANGQSSAYPITYTWTQVASVYAGNASAWLTNVTSYLGVDPNSTPAQYIYGTSAS